MKKRYLVGAIIVGIMSLVPIAIGSSSEYADIPLPNIIIAVSLFFASMIIFFYGIYTMNDGKETLATKATLIEGDWSPNVTGNYWAGRILDGICTFTFVLENGKEIKLKGTNSAQNEKLFKAKGKSGILIVLDGLEFVEDFITEDTVSDEEYTVIESELFLQKYQVSK